MKEFYLEIVTPVKPRFKGEVTSVILPGIKGEFQVLFNHAPLITDLLPGRIIIRQNNSDILFATSGGTAQIKNNHVTVLLDTLENASEIDINRASDSANRAKERLSINNKEKIDTARAEASLNRALVRIKVAKSV